MSEPTVIEELRIRGRNVEVWELRKKDEFSEETLIRAIRQNNRITTPILPAGTILYSQDGIMQVLLIWRPECELTIESRGRASEREDPNAQRFFNICWPCQVYGLKFQGTSLVHSHMWFVKGPIKGENDSLYTATIPNQSGSEMCLGSAYASELSASIAKTASKIIRYIYSSRYNFDMRSNLTKTPVEFGDRSRWIGDENTIDPRKFFKIWENWKNNAPDWREINNFHWQVDGDITIGGALDRIR